MYEILLEYSTVALELRVNKKMREGWEPLGGPMITPAGNFGQAMFKKAEKVVTNHPYDYKVRGSGMHDYEANR